MEEAKPSPYSALSFEPLLAFPDRRSLSKMDEEGSKNKPSLVFQTTLYAPTFLSPEEPSQ